jgi:hypothetical protein
MLVQKAHSPSMGSLVELYPTRGDKALASQVYDTYPDIIALDMKCKEVVVIEITSAADLRGLFDKITERQKNWFPSIRHRLESDHTIDSSWKIRFLGVVRETLVDSANAEFAGATDVHFFALEKAAFSFAYWAER